MWRSSVPIFLQVPFRVMIETGNNVMKFNFFSGQHLAYEMGLPWMTYPNTGRQVRMQDNSADKRSSFFFRQLSPQTVFSVAPVLTRLSTWEVVHCALHCLGTPTCMAVEVYCKVRDKCEWISCTLKAAPWGDQTDLHRQQMCFGSISISRRSDV